MIRIPLLFDESSMLSLPFFVDDEDDESGLTTITYWFRDAVPELADDERMIARELFDCRLDDDVCLPL